MHKGFLFLENPGLNETISILNAVKTMLKNDIAFIFIYYIKIKYIKVTY